MLSRGRAGRRGGLFGKLVSLIERTVYAQAACSSYECSGQNTIQNPIDGTCAGDGCTGGFKQVMTDKLVHHKQFIDKHGEDLPEIRNWTWGQPS